MMTKSLLKDERKPDLEAQVHELRYTPETAEGDALLPAV